MTNEPTSNPYVGPQTFTEAQGHLFFGREREASNLFARVLSERLVLFYAQSGAGKSSLINTRLIPQLREFGYAVLPVARVSGKLPDGVTEVDNVYLFNLMLSLDNSGHDPGRFAHMQLPQFLAGLSTDDGRRYVYEAVQPEQETEPPPPSAIPYILIIDQFEELITSNPTKWTQREEFFRQLNQAMVGDPKLWTLLSFREDYVAPIEPYAPLMMDRMRARFYMERLGVDAALEAVRRPAEVGGRPFAPGAAERLVEALCQMRVSGQADTIAGQYVEPVQLQVVCYQLWNTIEKRASGPITVDDLREAGDVNQALSKFYEQILASTLANPPIPITERQLRTWFEQELITPDKTRGMVRQGQDTTSELPNAIVAELQKRFILRSDTRAGDTRIEIVHDSFVEPILASNQAWRAQNQNPLVLAAEAWLADSKSPRRLLFSEQLRAAKLQLDAASHELNETESRKIVELLEASEIQERQRTELLSTQQMALLEPQKYISEMGWGVIFPAAPPSEVAKQTDAIKEALRPLLDHRQAEATLRRKEFYREFVGAAGYRPGETAHDFLARQGVGSGKANPTLMPYYLLLVGDPEAIPFEFQYQLDVQYAVGRVQFDTLDEYRRYAESVVEAETGNTTWPRRVALFAPQHEKDITSGMLRIMLAQPLVDGLEVDRPAWSFIPVFGDYATKARLGQLLGGEETPALIFIGSRGMSFPQGHLRQLAAQGAPICQDWPGPKQWSSELSPEFYFAADDIAESAELRGLIAFGFIPHGAGLSAFDDYYREKSDMQPNKIAERPFLAKLPRRMLSHPRGGALAFIGHVGESWSHSFSEYRKSTGVKNYAAVIERLLDGYPVGAAFEPFNQRYAELATVLSEVLNQQEQGANRDAIDIAYQWTATIDARNWIVIGDPAVRLMVSGLQPDLAGLRLFYKVENLRNEGDQLAQEGDLIGSEMKYKAVLEINPWLGFDPAIEAHSVAARTPMRKAKELAKEGKIEEAVALVEAAQRHNPELGLQSMKDVRLLAASYFLGKGREAAREGKYESALKLLERAAQLAPILGLNPTAEAKSLVAVYHAQQARRLAQAGQVDEAVAHFEKARALDAALKSDFDATQALEPKLEAERHAAQFLTNQGTKPAE